MVRFDSMPPRDGRELFRESDLDFSFATTAVEWSHDGRGFVFHASADWAWGLNGSRFQDVATAERAIADRKRRRSSSAA